ncbi:MAG: phosphatidylglycerophosphatase A family protein, partial [Actinomycetota bacterium]
PGLRSPSMARMIASFFGSGLLLRAWRGSDQGSGTIGSVLAVVIALGIPPWWGRLIALAVTSALGMWAIGQLTLDEPDPGWIVVDEAAGVFLATLGLSPPAVAVGFVVFRAADIAKRWFPGVRQAERIGGAAGIMSDDLVAGLYALAAGWLFQAVLLAG